MDRYLLGLEFGVSSARSAGNVFCVCKGRRRLWCVGGQAARRGVAGGEGVVLQFAPPRVHAPGAQMIRLASVSSLAFQRLSRATLNVVPSARLAQTN
eukprot:gene8080-biopygen3099